MRIGRSYAVRGISYLVIVSHDSPLQLGCVYPGDKVFHMSGWGVRGRMGDWLRDGPGNKKGRIGDGIGTDTDVTLLNKFGSLKTAVKLTE